MFSEWTNEQRRQFIDVRQVFEAYQKASQKWHHTFRGSMRWLERKGREYLHWKKGTKERSLGLRSSETEAKYEAFQRGRQKLKEHMRHLAQRLDTMAPVNRALGLGRVPITTSKIVRHLEKARLLGDHIVVVGANAIYAYESAAGVFVTSDLLATGDADLLWDVRQKLALVTQDVKKRGVIGILKQADRSFHLPSSRDFQAVNKKGFFVDLIRPEEPIKRQLLPQRKTLSSRDDDLHGAPIYGLQWLISSPKFEAVVLGEDGYPLRLVTVDPRAYSLHKVWISTQVNRDPLKKKRDLIQGEIVAKLCNLFLNKPFDSKLLQALPQSLRKNIIQIEHNMKAFDDGEPEPNW